MFFPPIERLGGTSRVLKFHLNGQLVHQKALGVSFFTVGSCVRYAVIQLAVPLATEVMFISYS